MYRTPPTTKNQPAQNINSVYQIIPLTPLKSSFVFHLIPKEFHTLKRGIQNTSQSDTRLPFGPSLTISFHTHSAPVKPGISVLPKHSLYFFNLHAIFVLQCPSCSFLPVGTLCLFQHKWNLLQKFPLSVLTLPQIGMISLFSGLPQHSVPLSYLASDDLHKMFIHLPINSKFLEDRAHH